MSHGPLALGSAKRLENQTPSLWQVWSDSQCPGWREQSRGWKSMSNEGGRNECGLISSLVPKGIQDSRLWSLGVRVMVGNWSFLVCTFSSCDDFLNRSNAHIFKYKYLKSTAWGDQRKRPMVAMSQKRRRERQEERPTAGDSADYTLPETKNSSQTPFSCWQIWSPRGAGQHILSKCLNYCGRQSYTGAGRRSAGILWCWAGSEVPAASRGFM